MKVAVIPIVVGELHQDNSIIKIGQNSEESSGDLRRLVLSQTPVRNHQLTVAWKTLKGENKNYDDNDNNFVMELKKLWNQLRY